MPGPQLPLYLLGRKLQDLLPIAFLPEDHALAIALMSYNGEIGYGLIGDYDAMSDLDVVAAGIEHALAELLDAARTERARGGRPRAVRGMTRAPVSGATSSGAGPRRTPAAQNGQRTRTIAAVPESASDPGVSEPIPDANGARPARETERTERGSQALSRPRARSRTVPRAPGTESFSILPKQPRRTATGPSASFAPNEVVGAAPAPATARRGTDRIE